VATIARQHDVPHFKDVDELLRAHKLGDLAVDGVILATPTQTHVPLAQSFVGSGLSILIEKPLSATGADGKSLLAFSKQDTKGVYMVGHHRRHNAYVKAVKEVLDKKQLGDVVAVNGGELRHSIHSYIALINSDSLGNAKARWILRYPVAHTAWSWWGSMAILAQRTPLWC
jgi:predicted dehydrogenase